MSRHYRQRLYRQRRFASRGRPLQPNAPGHLSYDACEMYDVGAVERAVLDTSIYKRCSASREADLGPSLGWLEGVGALDGTFCDRYTAAAIKSRAGFNEDPFGLAPGQGKGTKREALAPGR